MSYIKITEKKLNHIKIQFIGVDAFIGNIMSLLLGIIMVNSSLKPLAIMGLIFGVLLALGGGLGLLVHPYFITCILDNFQKTISIKNHKIVGTTVFECSTLEISKVQIEGGSFFYRICLQRLSKTSVPLTESYNLQTFRKTQKTAIAIAQFLNLNTQHLLFHPKLVATGTEELHKQWDRGMAEIKNAIASNPKDINLYLELAQMLDLQGLREEAVVILQKGRDLAIATNAHFQQRGQIEEKIREWSRF